MRRILPGFLVLLGMLSGLAHAQNAPPAKELRIRFGNAVAHATANFQSADSIEAKLRYCGSTLHPQIASLRVLIEMALDDARAALDVNAYDDAAASVVRAEALLDRFARRLGG
jgi:hypothetical protein